MSFLVLLSLFESYDALCCLMTPHDVLRRHLYNLGETTVFLPKKIIFLKVKKFN